jgi:hypothetical protein
MSATQVSNTGKNFGIKMAMGDNPLRDLVDLVGIEPTTSSMPWNYKIRILLTAKALKVGRVGKNH